MPVMATMQVMSIVRRTYVSQTVKRVLTVQARSKIKRGETIKRLQKENKALFGALVETKKEKEAREKREKKKVRIVSKNINNNTNDDSSKSSSKREEEKSQLNAEKLWILETNPKELTEIKLRKDFLYPRQTKTVLIKINDNSNDDNKSDSTNSPKDSAVSISSLKSSSKIVLSAGNIDLDVKGENNEEKKREIVISKAPRLPPDILVKNITAFSYLNEAKGATNTRREADSPQSISAYADKSKLSIPSVTRILNKTMSEASKLNLELWKQRMISELGVEGFEAYSRELLLNGKLFHSGVQNYLLKKPYELPETVEKSLRSVRDVLEDVSDVRVIESHVVHSDLFYRGIVDCVASYKGKLCVIDWKKSDKPKENLESTYDAPIQVASYIGALNSDNNYNFQIQNGLVVVAYTNGDPATIHEINPPLLNKYWIFWLRRLQRYYLDLKKSEVDSSAAYNNNDNNNNNEKLL